MTAKAFPSLAGRGGSWAGEGLRVRVLGGVRSAFPVETARAVLVGMMQ